jgi:glycosyltransferase involved in cell wall biosynthesis
MNEGLHMDDCANSPYSVLMSIYRKETASFFRTAIESIANQTIPPSQIVLVEDGPLTNELDKEIERFQDENPGLMDLVSISENHGLGYALAKGMLACRYEIVARMDTDDIAAADRLERQLQAFKEHPEIDMVGSQVTEFVRDPQKPLSISQLPVMFDQIKAFSKRRNPFRHPTMVLKKSSVLEAGNYNGDFLFFEDWDLFNRMLQNGCHALNIDASLVSMRVSEDFFGRRGGPGYIPYIWKFKVAQLRRGYFSFGDFLVSTVPHIAVSLMPNNLRSLIYTHILRKGVNQ